MFDTADVGCEHIRVGAGDVTQFAVESIRCRVGVLLLLLLLLVFLSVQMGSILLRACTANTANFAEEDLWLGRLFLRLWLTIVVSVERLLLWIYSYTIYSLTLVTHDR